MRRRVVEVSLVLGALFALGRTAEAQRGPGGLVGISFVAADAIGEMGALVDHGFGVQLEGGAPAAFDGHLRFRGDFGVLVYGLERQQLCYTYSCRVGSELTTTNSILYGGVGPEVVLGSGSLQPYVNATAGLSYFLTTSSLDDHDGYGPYLDTTNYSDLVLAWKLGGGLRMRVGRGHHPVYLDLGVERHRNGIANYLTVGDIVDHSDGSITVFPNRSEADLVTYKVGVSIGVGGHRHD